MPAPSISMPQSWLTPTSNSGQYSVVLYFQLRAKNPKAGQPISVINGKTQVQPDFLISAIRNRTITVTLFGVNLFLN